ncbi:MAG: trigger factor [Oscillospiraceae bacterium]|nr:trigger factor [Oscillospiraceae bacterium]
MNLKNVENKEKNTVVLTVEVPADEFDAAVEKVYRRSKGSIALPGFRKGKAPRKLVEQMYGADIFYEDAVNDLYPVALSEAVKESGLDMVGYPSVEMKELGKDGFTFEATIATRPVPVLGEYKGIHAPKAEVVITEQDIEDELFPYIRRATTQAEVERPAANGDIVTIDFEGFKDGVAFDGGKAEGYDLELGSGSFIPGFEDQIIGMSAGDEKDIDVTFPEDYGAPDLAGAPVVFKIKLHTVKENQKPELDDDFAQDVSEFDTLDEFKADLEKKLRERREKKAQEDFEGAILDKLIEGSELDVPDTMVQYEVDRTVEDYQNRLQGAGFTFEQYLQMMGSNLASFRAEAQVAALRQIQGDLIFAAIADAEDIQPTEEQIADEIKRLAEQYDMDEEQIKTNVPESEILRIVRNSLASKLVYDSAVIDNTPAEEPEAPAAEAAPVEEAADAPAEAE